MKIELLVVHTNEVQRGLLRTELRRRGHLVSEARDQAEAMRAIERTGRLPDLVVCSAALEEPGVLDLLGRLQQRWPRLPFLVTAGESSARIAVSCIATGAFAVLREPVDPEELEAWIGRALERRATGADRFGKLARHALEAGSGIDQRPDVRAALDNAEMMRRLAASDRLASLGQIAASISHEIRNPLNYVLENARYLEERLGEALPEGSGALAGELREAAHDVVEGAIRIRDLVRDVGAVASPDDTTQVPFDLCDAIRAAARMAAMELKGRAQLFLRLGPDTGVVGSVGRMTQVFVNLLVNAAQAIGRESARGGNILVVCRRHGDAVIAEVSDDGPGIAPENAAKLFEAFFTTKQAGQGTGLGLFLSRDVVRRHRGELRVRSTPGRGTTFSIELPADPARPVPGPSEAGQGTAPAKGADAAQGASGQADVGAMALPVTSDPDGSLPE